MKRFHIAFSFFVALIATPPAQAQDAAAGEDIFRKCSACHQVGDGAKNRVGPVLTDLIGRPAGSFAGYKYGKSMLQAGEAGLIWTPESIFEYLASPKAFLRTFLDDPRAKAKMSFKLPDEQDRKDVIAYLSSFSIAMNEPKNGFCVANNSADIHLFAVDAGAAGRDVQTLNPGEVLCTTEFSAPQSGFVSVFIDIDHDEGCSRLISAGATEGMIKYADFDRCEWSSHAG